MRTLKQNRKLVVITIFDGSQQIPIDVVAEDNFCGLDKVDEDFCIIKSLAIDGAGKPYIHSTKFEAKDNDHVFKMTEGWKPITFAT